MAGAIRNRLRQRPKFSADIGQKQRNFEAKIYKFSEDFLKSTVLVIEPFVQKMLKSGLYIKDSPKC